MGGFKLIIVRSLYSTLGIATHAQKRDPDDAGLKNPRNPVNPLKIRGSVFYSTVTDFAKLRGWSTLRPRLTAIW